MEEGLINKHKVCQSCGEISGPRIRRCPGCQGENFRPLTREENNGLPKMVYEFAGQPLLQSAYDSGKIESHMTNIFVT